MARRGSYGVLAPRHRFKVRDAWERARTKGKRTVTAKVEVSRDPSTGAYYAIACVGRSPRAHPMRWRGEHCSGGDYGRTPTAATANALASLAAAMKAHGWKG